MYDGLTARYTFSCPATGEARVRLSGFRSLEPLAGTARPVVYKVSFACTCGEEHAGLVAHGDLDWAPLAGSDVAFFNLMTQRLESASFELLEQGMRRIGAGEWPWSFFCYPEGRPRPVFPSAFRALAAADDRIGVAVRCPSCACTSVNVVTRRHVDEPFYSDRRISVIEHVFADDREATVAAFRDELDSASFDTARRTLS